MIQLVVLLHSCEGGAPEPVLRLIDAKSGGLATSAMQSRPVMARSSPGTACQRRSSRRATRKQVWHWRPALAILGCLRARATCRNYSPASMRMKPMGMTITDAEFGAASMAQWSDMARRILKGVEPDSLARTDEDGLVTSASIRLRRITHPRRFCRQIRRAAQAGWSSTDAEGCRIRRLS